MRKFRSLLGIALLMAGTLATADSTVGAKVNGVEVGKTTAASDEKANPARASCLNHCNTAESRCSSEVRRARQECSRRAANGGRDPMNPGYAGDYTYFCGYFGNQNACGTDIYSQGCKNRFARTYGICVDKMQNIATMRHDCQLSERDAQNFCRDELRDCKAACGPE